jgi:hypothetical protein
MKLTLTLLALLGFISFSLATAAHADTGDGSLTPTSYKIPIMKVSISKSDGTDEQTLFSCATDVPDNCMLDLNDTTVLDAITAAAGTKSIKVGSYTKINISTCPSSGNASINVKATGSLDIGGTTWRTEDSINGVSTAIGTAQETTIAWACSTVTVNPTQPIEVTEGGTNTLTLTVNLSNVMYTAAATSPGAGGCKAPVGGGRGLCTNFPFVIPYVGAGTVTTERYLVAFDSVNATALAVADANGQIQLAIDPSGNVFYAGTSPYLSNTSPSGVSATHGGNGMNYALSRVSQTDPSQGMQFSYDATANTVAFKVGGSLDAQSFGVTGFQRVTTQTGQTAPKTGGTVWQFKAFKQ